MLARRFDAYRWAAVLALWAVIGFLAVCAWRAQAASTVLYEKARGSVTREDALRLQTAGEFARDFAVEWATFRGDPGEYARRLSAFNAALEYPAPVSEGPQRVLSARVVRLEGKRQGNATVYTALVRLHVQRYVRLAETEAPSFPRAYLRERPDPADPFGLKKLAEGWVDDTLTVKVVVGERGGTFFACNLPVIAPDPAGPREDPARFLARQCSSEPSPEAAAAIRNFVKLYFTSTAPAELANYTVPGAGVTPVGGWEVKSIDVVSVDDPANPRLAFVRATVARRGVQVAQRLYLRTETRDGRVLVREVGSFAY
ncbi:conjugal transfer protein [Ammonifex thiophilus]|uniref:conjugal transfer protein n=1 Tax=Ammonifex thiophilus TaxID=444093 RepID=UPI001403C74C|nr:conjugal transfer protein [Ammonifex thiophilus]